MKRIDTLEILIYAAGALILIAMVCHAIACIYIDPPAKIKPEVKNTANSAIETHRIKCVEFLEGTCAEFVIFKIVKE